MNILFLDSIDEKTYGGMEEWIRLVASGLSDKGHKVTVAGRTDSVFLHRVRKTSDTVSILELKISGDFNPQTISELKDRIRDNRIDVVSVNFNKDVRLGGLAARLEGSTRVVWSVGLNITGDSLIHRWLTPKLIDGVIVPSESLKKQILEAGYIKREIVAVIPIGIPDMDISGNRDSARAAVRQSHGLSPESIVAVTSGRFVAQKGHIFLVEAAAQIGKDLPRLRFLLLGNGPLERELREQIAALGLADRFVFAGMLDDVVPTLEGCDFMVHPSIEEPFGIAVLEGMRAGLPIVASDVGGLPEVVGHDGAAVLVDPRDSTALAEAIGALATDPDRRARMSQQARQRYVNGFSAQKMLDRVESYFCDLTGEGRHGTT